ncbi:MAG: hypothetical protein AMXMBFR84_38690 [Candidatus Hydrogenedentota bacterium]
MNAQRGFALVSVIWILAVLTVLTLGFGHRALLDHRAAATAGDHVRCLNMAAGACNYGVALLRNQAALQGVYDALNMETPPPVSVVHPDLINALKVYRPGDPGSYLGDVARAVITDEESRISLNDSPEDVLDELEELSFTTVNDIMRRRSGPLSDDDDTTQPFLAVEEVRDLDGVTDRAWFGSEDSPGLRERFTVYGDGLINVNTASEEVLEAVPDLDSDIVSAILAYRSGPDGDLNTADDRRFRSFDVISGLTRVSPERLAPLSRYCKLESRFFTVTGFATLRQGKIRAQVKAVVEITGEGAVIHKWSEGVEGTDDIPGGF